MPDGVTILWWPEEGARLLRLRAEHQPRLVVIEGDLLPPPPPSWSEEEWLRSPFPPEQLDLGLTALRARLREQPLPPEADDAASDGLMSRLRRRIEPLGLRLHALRDTGYLLCARTPQLA